MVYSDFKLNRIIKNFNLILNENTDLFVDISEVRPSEMLQEFLKENAALAVDINTEKARSELIIAPILLEVRRQVKYQVGLFSGSEFNVAPERGLNGTCDFLISLSPERLFISAPVITLVEAKKEDIKAGFGQCVAEMLAAQLFNEEEGNQIPTIYGAVTSGTVWRFLKLEGQMVYIDRVEYYLSEVAKILGILLSAISSPS
ncbi:hypothetical protein [Oscillatoria acuminata]|uniref:Type I restriction enzyme R protein N-terminal domain-containing protein n=1 Tax=Oscillatoria acuminata PCC 6304 TaxID=56110 RepID=K9TM53_9CYAN|nr:hypothetical protein [Oscillatoria acuminata]AFY83927.1 hypothetical protein Oscil6304_4407 [Oscillatoria acuminata PCC 6304]